ncbi:MAG TPA: GNAT family N-acetyltransferase [Beijerinckia sp.]|nr:GNAT family N-acetyltransferase [Beijerinckia sp.]
METTLLGGETIRRLWACDGALFRDHLLRLDAESRYDRFGTYVSDESLKDYAEGCFGLDAITYGYFVDGIMRGAGELRAIGSAFLPKGAVEGAFSVAKDWRRRGIGTELMARILRAARNRRIDTLYLSCLAHNRSMVGLAKKFETDLTFETDAVTGKLIARTPTPSSLFEEFVDDSLGLAEALFDFQQRVLAGRAISV